MCNSTTCPNNHTGVGLDFLCSCEKRTDKEEIEYLNKQVVKLSKLNRKKRAEIRTLKEWIVTNIVTATPLQPGQPIQIVSPTPNKE